MPTRINFSLIFVTFLFASSVNASNRFEDNLPIDLKLYDIQYSLNKDAIEYLYNKGIISGYPDNTFKPNNPINRAELLKILVGDNVNSLEVMDEWGNPHSEYQNCFSDVGEEWFAVFICFAKSNGWINGYPNGTFRPAQPVNKVEAIKMLVNIEGFVIPESVRSSVFDDADIASWYAPYLDIAFEKGLLELDRGNFGVSEPMTRGSISESMYRVAMMKLNATDTYVSKEKLPSRSQARTGNLYPINLVNNQKWELEIGISESSFINIKRDGESFEVDRYVISPKTGGKTHPYDEPYHARFIKKSGEQHVKIFECHYFYKHIKVDLRCDEFYIPAIIGSPTVRGYEELFDKEGLEVTITIVSKAKEEIECNVKAKEGIYYTKDSKAPKPKTFRCFETEDDAIRAGNKKSFK